MGDLQAEQTVRENLDPDQQIIETGLRVAAHQQQVLTDRTAAQRADREALLSPHRYAPAYTPPDLGRDGPSLSR
jgi:hypothetical protein